MKKTFVVIGSVFLISLITTGATSQDSQPQLSAKTLYYDGIIETTKLLEPEEATTSQRITLKKIMDPLNNRIVEISCAPTPSGYVVSPIYMKVDGRELVIADKPDYSSEFVKGTGIVFGSEWDWENLTFDMETKFGGRTSWVKDVNFVSGEFVYGTKYVFFNIGTEENPKRMSEAGLLMNLNMKAITIAEFEAANTELGCDNSKFNIEK